MRPAPLSHASPASPPSPGRAAAPRNTLANLEAQFAAPDVDYEVDTTDADAQRATAANLDAQVCALLGERPPRGATH